MPYAILVLADQIKDTAEYKESKTAIAIGIVLLEIGNLW